MTVSESALDGMRESNNIDHCYSVSYRLCMHQCSFTLSSMSSMLSFVMCGHFRRWLCQVAHNANTSTTRLLFLVAVILRLQPASSHELTLKRIQIETCILYLYGVYIVCYHLQHEMHNESTTSMRGGVTYSASSNKIKGKHDIETLDGQEQIRIEPS